MYPVTLTFCSTQKFRGRHDANSYGGTSIINKNNISFIIDSITDCMDIPWFFDYVFFELKQIDQAFIFSQNNDTTNMQLKLSNQENSIILFFINKKWFEETYFKLEEWYD